MKIYKHVIVGGLTWAVLSKGERATTHAGRHFFASRCNSRRPWIIREHDCDITQTGCAKPLLVWRNDYETADLSQAVKEICGQDPEIRFCHDCLTTYAGDHPNCPNCGAENADPHPSVTFEEHRAAMQARRFTHNQGNV